MAKHCRCSNNSSAVGGQGSWALIALCKVGPMPLVGCWFGEGMRWLLSHFSREWEHLFLVGLLPWNSIWCLCRSTQFQTNFEGSLEKEYKESEEGHLARCWDGECPWHSGWWFRAGCPYELVCQALAFIFFTSGCLPGGWEQCPLW